MFLIVGLGNVGKEYENTRHNIGFIVVDNLIKRYNINNHQEKYNSDIYSGNIGNEKVLIVKPRTYMNNSGIAVAQIKNFYKIDLNNIIVIHDDMDLDFLKLKTKIGGGSAGHNGLKSLDSHIGQNYYRLRFGIGKPLFKDDVVNFVLNKFTNSEMELINKLSDIISSNITLLFTEKKEIFLNKVCLDCNSNNKTKILPNS